MAVEVLRKASCYEEALHLSKKHGLHTAYLRMQIEDRQDYKDALEYIEQLPTELASGALQLYGKDLVSNLTEETTRFLIELCSPSIQFVEMETEELPAEEESAEKTAEESAEKAEKMAGQPQEEASEAPLEKAIEESLQTPLAKQEVSDSPGDDILNGYCTPDTFIHCFVDYPLQLKYFLHQMIVLRSDCDSTVWNTLLELSLRKDLVEKELRAKMQDACTEAIVNETYQKEAMGILQDPKANYDDDQALILVQMYDFKEGKLYLYRKLQMYSMLLKYYMELGNTEKVIDVCKEFGHQDQSLWIQLLTFYAEMDTVDVVQLLELLQYINDNEIVPPLMVLQILSRNRHLTLGSLRTFIVRCIQDRQRMEKEDTTAADGIKTSIQEMEDEIRMVKTYPLLAEESFLHSTSGKVIQQRKCQGCKQDLDLPSVHFMCGHSYHKNCVDTTIQGCPCCTFVYQ